MIQVFTPVTPLVTAVGFHVFVFIVVTIEQLPILHIVLIQEVTVSDADEIQLRSIGELLGKFLFQIFIDTLIPQHN